MFVGRNVLLQSDLAVKRSKKYRTQQIANKRMGNPILRLDVWLLDIPTILTISCFQTHPMADTTAHFASTKIKEICLNDIWHDLD